MKKLLLRLLLFSILSQCSFAQWEPIGPSDKSISDIEIRGSDIFVITSDDGALYHRIWFDVGFVWLKIVEANAEDIAIAKSGKLFLVKDDSLFHSSNNGRDWTSINLFEQIADSLQYGTTARAKKIFINPNGTIYCHFRDGVYICDSDRFALSKDGGLTWTTPNLYESGKLFAFMDQFIFTVGSVICFDGNGGEASYISSDYGETWQIGGAPATTLIECFSNGNIIMYGANWGSYSGHGTISMELMVSKDTCRTWETIDTLVCLRGISVAVGSNEYLVAETRDFGMVLYSDEGVKLGSINEGLSNLNVLALGKDNNGFIYAGTEDGLWRRNLSEVTSIKEGHHFIPANYILEQNYPNPFNPNTKIKYTVPQTSQVQIKVFDVLGREIEILINGKKTSGTFELTWNAANLPSGVYFYQLRAGDFMQTKKMILMK